MPSSSRAFVSCIILPLFALSPSPAGQNPQLDSAHYAIDPRMAEKLAVMEETLAVNLYKLKSSMQKIEHDNSCLKLVGKYIDEFEEDDEALANVTGKEAAVVVKANPILVFKMIRRIYVTLITETVPVCEQRNSKKGDKCVTQITNEAFATGSMPPLTELDWQDALMGILRIQYIYGFNATSQLRLGVLNGIKTKSYLNFHDCLSLAEKAMDMNAEAIAYQWLISSDLCFQEGKYSAHSSVKKLKSNLEKSWQKLISLADVGTINELHTKLGSKRQERMETFHDFQDYATCRGETILPPSVQARLYCFHHKPHPYFYINPVKTEILSESPRVLQFYDFVGNHMINHAKQLRMERMLRSSLSTTDNRELNHYQISLIPEHKESQDATYARPVMRKLIERIEMLIGLNVLKIHASDLQVSLFSPLGGDSDFYHDSTKLSQESIALKGQRLATLLMFIFDETVVGGYTAFSELGISANPIPGSAVFWYNVRKNETPVDGMIYGDCPVIMGNGEGMCYLFDTIKFKNRELEL